MRKEWVRYVKGCFGAAMLASLLGLGVSACSAETGETGEWEDLGELSEALDERCKVEGTKVVTGGFATPWTSERTYNECLKAKNVRIEDYASEYAVGGYTEIAWGDTAPPASQCLDSYLTAYLFELDSDGKWVHKANKSATGDLITDDLPSDVEPPPEQPGRPVTSVVPVPKDPGLFGPPVKNPCRAPRVFFHTSEMVAGRTYRIAATARLPGKITQKLKFSSVAGTCGQETNACCFAEEKCADDLQCNAQKKCAKCGDPGEQCCSGACNAGATCSASGNECEACGSPGELCCASGNAQCDKGLECNGTRCEAPCGAKGEACCKGSKCDSGLECKGATCQPKADPPPACGGPGALCCNGTTCNSGLFCQKVLDTKLCAPQPNCQVSGANCCYGPNGARYCDSNAAIHLVCDSETEKCTDSAKPNP